MSTTMPPVPKVTEADILQFLAAARETITPVPICWLATRLREGGTNARAVNSSAGSPGSDEWTRRFLVRRNSRKVLEMLAAPLLRSHFKTPLATATSPWVAVRRSSKMSRKCEPCG
jgi:hypothetical protein